MRPPTILYGIFPLVTIAHAIRSNHVDKQHVKSEEENSLIVTTWAVDCFQQGTAKAWQTLMATNHRLDAVVAGCSSCESSQCDGSVGYGNHPDESGETTLDAMVMDGVGHRLGAVANLRQVKNAVGVARAVMEHTKHSMLCGEAVSRFAVEMGFPMEDLHTNESWKDFHDWIKKDCQPNFRTNVSPDPKTSCGPYTPKSSSRPASEPRHDVRGNHDTVGMLAVDRQGDMAVGTSTNGASHKVPGRVADSGLVGAGGYVDNEVGVAAATGDGDVMMRTLPSYQCVESMRLGSSPSEAAADAVARIAKRYPDFSGAVICANKNRAFGAACHNLGVWKYSYQNSTANGVQTATAKCTGNRS